MRFVWMSAIDVGVVAVERKAAAAAAEEMLPPLPSGLPVRYAIAAADVVP